MDDSPLKSELKEKSEPSAVKAGLVWLFLYIGISLALFFIVALAVFMVRGRQSKTFTMPELNGKNFIDIYNGLQRLELRVNLVKKGYRDLPAGMILSQSIAPGQLIGPRDKLELTVNQPRPFLTMPELKHTSLKSAQALLKRIPGEGGVYSVSIAAVSYMETEKYSAGTVLMQYPPAGSSISWPEQVYLLVAKALARRGEESTKVQPDEAYRADRERGDRSYYEEDRQVRAVGSAQESFSALKGQKVSVVAEYFHRNRLDYRIRSLPPPPLRENNGSVHALEKERGGPYLLDIYYHQPAIRTSYGYEKIGVKLNRAGACEARQHFYDADIKKRHSDSQVIFYTTTHDSEEEVKILFYRLGAVEVVVKCGKELVYKEDIIPTYYR